MGLFATLVHSDGRWATSPAAEQYLAIEIHDSDFAVVDYRPRGAHCGRFYLGIEPRHYFDNPTASDPVDIDGELQGFVDWARTAVGADLTVHELRGLTADPDGGDPEAVFVEESVVALVALLGLPLPAELRPEE